VETIYNINKSMIKEYSILKHHGKQFVPDLTNVELAPLFRGRPVISDQITADEINELIDLCPTSAFVTEPFGIDLGKCVFCKECEFLFPDRIHFTNDYKIATNDPEKLIIRVGDQAVKFNEEQKRKEIQKIFSGSLKLRQVSAAGDNSCEMELNAAGNVNFDMGRYGIEFVASPRHADGIVITGPLSENMAEALQICYDATPAPKIIILVGTDAISGGIFTGSPSLNRSFIEKHNIDLYVPGNPAHPLTFINGILSLLGKV
jgi:Ni,Fe-hydrogenase III small subunit